MDSIDILFGFRCAATVSALVVAWAMRQSVCRFVREGFFGRQYSDRFGAGFGLMAGGTAILSLVQLAQLTVGVERLRELVPSPLIMITGISIMHAGLFLGFTAWMAATKRMELKRAVVLWVVSLVFLGAFASLLHAQFLAVRP